MTRKIFRSVFIAAVAVLLLSFSVITCVLYDRFSDTSRAQLQDELSLAAQGVEQGGKDYLFRLESRNYRLTWVASDGTVLYDTQTDASTMDNHKDREEIREALVGSTGESTRYSDTLTEKMLYSAQRLSDGTVLRISMGLDSVFALLFDVLVPMLLLLIPAVLLSALLARRMAKSIVKPLNALDLEHPAENDAYEELSPMLGKIAAQHRQITEQVNELRRRTDEFEQITSSMSEGLVLLDQQGAILSMNPAARKLFGTDGIPLMRDFLTVDRSPCMSSAIKDAFAGKHREFREQRNGNEYQFGISRIESDGKTVGAVLLCFDVTEEASAERNRREFTANVSHELKTPLQSIIGSAELLANGLVKPEDTQRFVGNIKNEATRLVSLIDDIIRLSQLDENSASAAETVDLYEVAWEVIEALDVSAAKKNITVHINGEPCFMNGVRRYLYEILYNLCDNAIRYNIEGGEVTVSLRADGERPVLSVSDTGIGIPTEHQGRIFERFYRVDKSHSKETGGTGLGLSIVKHAVAYHGGTIKLESTPGKGTVVTVTF